MGSRSGRARPAGGLVLRADETGRRALRHADRPLRDRRPRRTSRVRRHARDDACGSRRLGGANRGSRPDPGVRARRALLAGRRAADDGAAGVREVRRREPWHGRGHDPLAERRGLDRVRDRRRSSRSMAAVHGAVHGRSGRHSPGARGALRLGPERRDHSPRALCGGRWCSRARGARRLQGPTRPTCRLRRDAIEYDARSARPRIADRENPDPSGSPIHEYAPIWIFGLDARIRRARPRRRPS